MNRDPICMKNDMLKTLPKSGGNYTKNALRPQARKLHNFLAAP